MVPGREFPVSELLQFLINTLNQGVDFSLKQVHMLYGNTTDTRIFFQHLGGGGKIMLLPTVVLK
jgi:hypothetical protein